MSTFSSACKPIHLSPSSRDHPCDSVGLILSQGGFLTHNQGQMLGPELSLTEMTEVEYKHLHQLIQAHVDAQAGPPDEPDTRAHLTTVMVENTAGSSVFSPPTTTTAIDLSTSTVEHCVGMPGEKTPASYGKVPDFVLARIRGEDSLTEPHANSSISSQKRARSAARICLEKRFDAMSADTPRQKDIQSAVLSNLLTMLQQSAEAQEAVVHPQMQKWIKTNRVNPCEVTSPYVGGVLNPVTNMCGQVIGHIPHLNKHQSLIIPKSFLFNICPEGVVTKAHYTSGSNSTEEKPLVNMKNDAVTPAVSRKCEMTYNSEPIKDAKAAPDSAGESGSSSRKRGRSYVSLSQRREKHNSKERERRRKIRLYCDELNMLVPFCDPETDKVTTLHWATAFLSYMNKMYGDTFKEEFQRACNDEKGLFLDYRPSSGQDPIHREMDGSLSIPLTVEQ